MSCGTSLIPNGTWCVPSAPTIRPAACSTTPRTGSGSGSTPAAGGSASTGPVLAGQVLLQPADVGGQAAVLVRGFADDRRARGADHAEQQGGIDGPGADVGVPVPAGAELIPRVVAVHQVDPAGDGLDPVGRVGEVDAGRVGVAGVQAEAQVGTTRVS